MDRPGERRSRRSWRHVVQVIPTPPERIAVEQQRPPRSPAGASGYLALGFLLLIVVGSLLLTLPVANRMGEVTPYLTALFTATSAVCVTGLVVVDTLSYWSPFGQAVILLLIQVGGVGFLTTSTVLLLLIGRRASLRDRILLREAHGVTTLGGILGLTRQVVLVTLLFQGVGIIILFLRFALDHPLDWALWLGVFHAISAFNNAGFDLMGGFNSLAGYSQDPVVILTVALLVLLGAISFTVIIDVYRQRNFRTLLLDTKLVLVTAATLLAVGSITLLVLEYRNPSTLGPMGLPAKIMNALFMTVSRTSGFSSVSVGHMAEASLLLLMALMYIGGAAGSMGGGIKMNTFAVITAAVVSSLKGRRVTTAFNRELPQDHVSRALTIALVALGLVFFLTLALTITEPFTLIQILFEAVSAFGIVGLSTGITPDLSIVGRLVVVVTMYVGRVGPLTLALALAAREKPARFSYPEERVKIG